LKKFLFLSILLIRYVNLSASVISSSTAFLLLLLQSQSKPKLDFCDAAISGQVHIVQQQSMVVATQRVVEYIPVSQLVVYGLILFLGIGQPTANLRLPLLVYLR
jgi:hypothetical protein